MGLYDVTVVMYLGKVARLDSEFVIFTIISDLKYMRPKMCLRLSDFGTMVLLRAKVK